MSAIEYKLNYFKKYFPFKHFIKDLPDLIGEQEIDLITNLIWYVNFKFSHKIFVNSDFLLNSGFTRFSNFLICHRCTRFLHFGLLAALGFRCFVNFDFEVCIRTMYVLICGLCRSL